MFLSRRTLMARRLLGFMLCLAAMSFLVWLVARGPESFRDDSCIGEKALNLPSQSRLDSFCNEPQNMVDDVFEGHLPSCLDKSRFELVQVIAVFRHGDRAPLIEQAGLGGPEDFECGVSGNRWDVLDQVIVRRLAGRREKVTFPLHPGKSGQQCRAAALTTKGFEQHYTMGDLFRQRYIDSGLLKGSATFSKSKDLFVRVTGASRCMQSAGAFLAGLRQAEDAEVLTHPDLWFRAFPSQLFKRGNGQKHSSKECEEAVSRQRKAVKLSSAYLQATQERFEANMARMSRWLGKKRTALPDITFLCDIIQDEFCRGKKKFCRNLLTLGQSDKAQLPATEQNCLPLADVNSIVASCDEAFTLNYSLPFSRILIQPFLQQIILHLQDALGGGNESPTEMLSRRLLLFFGHDSTIIPLLTSLGIYDGVWPPLASRVTFELWQCTADNCHQHKVRLLYNGRPLQGDLTDTMGFCDFSQLTHLVEKREKEVLTECST